MVVYLEITVLNCTQDSSSPTVPLHQILQREDKELHLLVLWKGGGEWKMSNIPFTSSALVLRNLNFPTECWTMVLSLLKASSQNIYKTWGQQQLSIALPIFQKFLSFLKCHSGLHQVFYWTLLCTKPLPPKQQKEAGNCLLSLPVAQSRIFKGLQAQLSQDQTKRNNFSLGKTIEIACQHFMRNPIPLVYYKSLHNLRIPVWNK